VSYTETYGDIRRRKRSFTVLVHGDRIQSPFSSVYDRIAPYTVTEIYDRRQPYTECVNLDLDKLNFFGKSRHAQKTVWIEIL
jgi:hypothetical protein